MATSNFFIFYMKFQEARFLDAHCATMQHLQQWYSLVRGWRSFQMTEILISLILTLNLIQSNSIQFKFNSYKFILFHFNSIQFNSIQFKFNSIQFILFQFNSIQFNSIQFNLIQFNSIQFNSNQIKSIQFNSNSIQCNSIQYNSN